MGALAEQQTRDQQVDAVNELQQSEDALRASPGNRSDTASNQIGGGDLNFNPANDAPDAGGSSGVASIGTQTPASSSNEWESVMDFARQNGYDVGQHTDDRAFIQSLLQQAAQRKQEDYYTQVGRQYAANYVKQQQAPAQPPAAAGPKPWEAPQFDRRWMGMVDYDPASGLFLGKSASVPAHIVDGVNAYQQWSEKYGQNPMSVVEPWAKEAMPAIIQKEVNAALGNYRKEQAVNGLIQQNSEWLYQKDQFGNPVVGQNGRYVPTQNGLRYGQYVNELERSGITDPYLVDRYAKAHLQADIAADASRNQQRQAPAAQQQNAGAAGHPQQNVRQSRGPLNAPANEPAPDQTEMRLEDRLRLALDGAGYGTDADFKFDEL